MTCGYIATDLDALLTLTSGTVLSSRICRLLSKLSKVSGSIGETRKLGARLYRCLIALLVIFCVDFASYVYFAWIRSGNEFKASIYCTILGEIKTKTKRCSLFPFADQPFGVVVRGLLVIVSTIQIGAVFMFVLLISVKFRDLSEAVNFSIQNCSTKLPSKDRQGNVKLNTMIQHHSDRFVYFCSWISSLGHIGKYLKASRKQTNASACSYWWACCPVCTRLSTICTATLRLIRAETEIYQHDSTFSSG